MCPSATITIGGISSGVVSLGTAFSESSIVLDDWSWGVGRMQDSWDVVRYADENINNAEQVLATLTSCYTYHTCHTSRTYSTTVASLTILAALGVQ